MISGIASLMLARWWEASPLPPTALNFSPTLRMLYVPMSVDWRTETATQ